MYRNYIKIKKVGACFTLMAIIKFCNRCSDMELRRDAGTGGGGAGGAAAPLAFCWEGQGGQKCPLNIKNII